MKIKTIREIKELINKPKPQSARWQENFYNKKWVAVDDVLKYIDNLRKSNDMWRDPVDKVFCDFETKLEGE